MVAGELLKFGWQNPSNGGDIGPSSAVTLGGLHQYLALNKEIGGANVHYGRFPSKLDGNDNDRHPHPPHRGEGPHQ